MQNSPLIENFDLFDSHYDWAAVYGEDGCNQVFSRFVQYIINRYAVTEENAHSFCVSWCTNSRFRLSFLVCMLFLIELFTFDFVHNRTQTNNKDNN